MFRPMLEIVIEPLTISLLFKFTDKEYSSPAFTSITSTDAKTPTKDVAEIRVNIKNAKKTDNFDLKADNRKLHYL